MPSGRTHLKIEASLLAIWGGTAAGLALANAMRWPSVIGFVSAYAFSMFFLSPDLDLARSDAYDRWGWFRGLWFPYAWAFKHRQISHHLLWGPLSRMLYLAVLLATIGLLVFAALGRTVSIRSWTLSWLAPISLGLYLPNVEHILVDRLVTAWRRKKRRL